MYKCLSCGNLFEEGEQKTWEEKVGEYGSAPYFEKHSGCPICGREYEETKKCQVCNSEHLEEDLINGVCEDCFKRYSTDIDVCYQAGKVEKSTIEINMFLAEAFDAETIEEILLDHLKETELYIKTHKKNIDNFANDDKEWFAEKLVEVLKNEK